MSDVVEEAPQVAALGRFVAAREAQQLVHVRQTPLAPREGEHVALVPGVGERAQQPLRERQRRRGAALSREVRGEAREALAVGGGERLVQVARGGRALGPGVGGLRGGRALGPGVPGVGGPRVGAALPGARRPRAHPRRAGVERHQRERVGGEAHERGGEHRVQRHLVQGIGQRAQPRQQVAHLLVAPEGADGRERAQAALLQRALVYRQVAAGAQQHRDVARRGLPLGHQVGHALGEQARFGVAPERRGGQLARDRPCQRALRERPLRPRAPVGEQHLDRGLGGGGVLLAGGPQWGVLLPEARGEHGVDGGHQRRAGAEVVDHAHRLAPPLQLAAALPEELDLGVAEAVDRLPFVADGEQVARARAAAGARAGGGWCPGTRRP